MKLRLGTRLHGYVITEVMHENAWHVLYGGKKAFALFDFNAKKSREAEPHEWLDVCLRTLKYPFPDDRDDVLLRRRMAKLEVRRIYGHGQSRLWPEPVDLFEVENTIDPFEDAALRVGEPILVFARPRGESMEAWQKGLLPLTSIFAVLAELLAFVQLTHDQGILLQCLHPEHLLIDRAGRVHDLAGDLALDLKHMQGEGAAPPSWRTLFPDDRFPPGFAAPEMYAPTRRIDRRTDLYSWGAAAMWLLAGVSPAQIALEANQRWAPFLPEHFAQLRRQLADTPHSYLRDWAEQLDVSAAALCADWPENFVALMRRIVAADPALRPDSVVVLKQWIVRVPPEPAEKVAVFFQESGEVTVYIRLPNSMPADTSLEIRRQLDQPPRRPEQGVLVYEGPTASEVRDTEMPVADRKIFYTVFLRRGIGDNVAYSQGVSAAARDVGGRGPRRDDRFTRERRDLLDRLFVYPVDPQTWPNLEALARARYAGDADARLVKWLCRRLGAAPTERRAELSALLADVLIWHRAAERLAPHLSRRVRQQASQVAASSLLFDIALRLQPPHSPDLLTHLQPLVGMKAIPLPSRLRLLAVLWQTTSGSGPASLELLRAFVQNRGKLKAIQQLHEFEQIVGPGPALTQVLAELQEQLRMTCPRCGCVLPRRPMVEHLWNEHRLLLQGDQVRDPWNVIQDWLIEYRHTANPAAWRQAAMLAQQAEPETGLVRLQRLWQQLWQ
jgi:hypothetical protein